MRQSKLFTKTLKQAPKGEAAKNAQLLERAGFVQKYMSGVYVFLPLGWRVIRNINRIIREEMDRIGGVELNLSALQDPDVWERTDRWQGLAEEVWFKTKLNSGKELGLGWTHEEPLTEFMKRHIQSYKDLPVYPYQIQLKFRNELRAKSGLMRVREFIMKDLYSFNRTEEEQDEFYEKIKQAYLNVFARAGLKDRTFLTLASGGDFSKFSHEFQTLSEAGEDTVYLDEEKQLAVNREIYTDEVIHDLGLEKNSLVEKKGIEVGNIFKLGTRFSEAIGLFYTDKNGEERPVVMGSYGIGPGRLMGTIAEALSDEQGLVWPEETAPFAVHLLGLDQDASGQYQTLLDGGIEVLYDDRDESTGSKFADSDLIGIPYRVVVSKQTGDKVEVKRRDSDKTELVSVKELVEILKN